MLYPTKIVLSLLSLAVLLVLTLPETHVLAQTDQPIYLPESEDVFPRSTQPADEVNVFDASRLPRQTQAMVASIQGLVNRQQPNLYLLLSRNRIVPLDQQPGRSSKRQGIDQVWLDWLLEHDYLQSTTTIDSVPALLDHYQIKDVVIVDPQLPSGLNIATMVAAVRGVPLAFPEDVQRYDLNPIEDLRDRWTTNIDAYRWAFENLWPKMNQRAIGILSPRIHGHLRDYLVGQKIFTFWISKGDYQDDATTAEDLDFFKRILKEMPVNIPVVGYPNGGGADTGIGEGLGVKLLSDHGKFLVPTDWHTNLSIWTGWQSKQQQYRQPEARKLKYDPSKRYLSIVVSDGDNMNLWLDFMPTRKYWRSQLRGKIPLGWTMGTAMSQLHAPLLDYYYESMTEADSFGCALSGMGYMYPQHFGEAYGEHQAEILRRHMKLANQFTKALDLHWFWGTIIGNKGQSEFQTITSEIENLDGILEGYGRQWWRDEPYLVNGTPVFHFLNDAVDPEPTCKQVLANLRKLEPKFGVIFIQNWPFDLPAIRSLQETMEAEDASIEWVRPDELADLFRQSSDAKSP